MISNYSGNGRSPVTDTVPYISQLVVAHIDRVQLDKVLGQRRQVTETNKAITTDVKGLK